jgi:hypothetical protein
MNSRGDRSHPCWRAVNGILGCLREAGFSAETTDLAYHALESHIAGFTLWVAQLEVDDAELPDLAAAFVSELPVGAFPYLIEHVSNTSGNAARRMKGRSLSDSI